MQYVLRTADGVCDGFSTVYWRERIHVSWDEKREQSISNCPVVHRIMHNSPAPWRYTSTTTHSRTRPSPSIALLPCMRPSPQLDASIAHRQTDRQTDRRCLTSTKSSPFLFQVSLVSFSHPVCWFFSSVRLFFFSAAVATLIRCR